MSDPGSRRSMRSEDEGCQRYDWPLDRRAFLGRCGGGIAGAALAHLLNPGSAAALEAPASPPLVPGILAEPHHHPRAQRIIYLFQSGGPSQLDLYDHKPLLEKLNGEQLPESVRRGQRLTGMSANQASLPLARSIFGFRQHGRSGAWLSELVPEIGKVADEICFIKSVHTEAINHDPAITFFQTGSQIAGRPSMGSWLSYGLGSSNDNLPAFVVLISKDRGDQPLYARLWGNGFLPSIHQGVQFRPGRDPVLYLSDPPGLDARHRRPLLDGLAQLHDLRYRDLGDPELNERVAQYEMAFRMQTSVPEVLDVSREPATAFELYGPESRDPGTFAANCLLARRLAERGVRFIQLYHKGWDQHDNLPSGIRRQAKDIDRASAALILDLKRRGLFEDTIVVWGGEFGRTNYSQGKLSKDNYGRDHHPRCFTVWAAGGGFRPGISHGETDEFGYNVARDPVHVHDLQATLLHLLGIDHERLIFKHQGRRYRLTDVHGEVVREVIEG